MPRYKVRLTEQERHELEMLVQKGGKGYRIKHAQILLKLDEIPENAEWTYDRIKDAYSAAHATIAGVAKTLYKAFSPEEAHRIANRFEWHYIPKHGSWLDMAEIEIGTMCRQALAKPLPDLVIFKKQVKSWILRHNIVCSKVNWQFSTVNARIKLKRLYPTIL